MHLRASHFPRDVINALVPDTIAINPFYLSVFLFFFLNNAVIDPVSSRRAIDVRDDGKSLIVLRTRRVFLDFVPLVPRVKLCRTISEAEVDVF